MPKIKIEPVTTDVTPIETDTDSKVTSAKPEGSRQTQSHDIPVSSERKMNVLTGSELLSAFLHVSSMKPYPSPLLISLAQTDPKAYDKVTTLLEHISLTSKIPVTKKELDAQIYNSTSQKLYGQKFEALAPHLTKVVRENVDSSEERLIESAKSFCIEISALTKETPEEVQRNLSWDYHALKSGDARAARHVLELKALFQQSVGDMFQKISTEQNIPPEELNDPVQRKQTSDYIIRQEYKAYKALRADLKKIENIQNTQEKIDGRSPIEGVDLQNFGSKVLPPEIGLLTDIGSLTMTRTKFTFLPEEMGLLTHLYSLDLRNSEQLTSLPENLGNLPELENIYIGGTAIKELPSALTENKKIKIQD